ncbi:short-chain dehydrogenase/reductase-like protein SDR [Xylaria digitata]|nr:short-chain dehydrogenase/reductase-like protein SDR [Xylaria digitata]
MSSIDDAPAYAVWFITGCSSGIGQALAHVVSQSSCRVLELDVTSTDSIEEALEATLSKFGRIEIVVNNAGYTLAGDTEAASDQEARAVMDTNFWGMVNVSKRCLRILGGENPKSGQQGGVILNSSGFTGYPGQAFYHASKFAMEGWTESVAKEVPSAWNIHLCNLEPGGVKTNYATSSPKSMTETHPAYADPSYPANQLLNHMKSEEGRALWAEPIALAATIFELVSRGKRIPIRVPWGSDAWGMILKDVESTKNDLEEIKSVRMSVGDAKQLDSIHFLAKP